MKKFKKKNTKTKVGVYYLSDDRRNRIWLKKGISRHIRVTVDG